MRRRLGLLLELLEEPAEEGEADDDEQDDELGPVGRVVALLSEEEIESEVARERSLRARADVRSSVEGSTGRRAVSEPGVGTDAARRGRRRRRGG